MQLRGLSAPLTRIRALHETPRLQATREIEATLAEADAWIEMSGAKSYEPFLHVERAELARLSGDEAARECELHGRESFATRTGFSPKSGRPSAQSRWQRISAHEMPTGGRALAPRMVPALSVSPHRLKPGHS